MFVRWSDTDGFAPGNFRWLRIRLREGAWPDGSVWTRFASASLWARRTIAVAAYATVEGPAEVADALTRMRLRFAG